MKWRTFIKSDSSTYPKKDTLRLCFDSYMNEHVILRWNSHYECWDDPMIGDTYRHSDYVSKYEYMNSIINMLDMNSMNEKREA